jgi:polyhydroxyalkanoate synthesis regulator phasin
MSTKLWEDFAKRSRELYEQQAELAKAWLDGQAQLSGTFAMAGQNEAPSGMGADAAAMAELWRSWLGLGGSLGATIVPGMAEPGRIASDTLGRFLDPLSMVLAGGGQVGETIRKLTEGPRLADLGAIERRMGKVMQLWLRVQQAARAYEGIAAGAWHEANQRFAREFQDLHRAGKAPTQPKEALKLWLDVANRTLLETHRSDTFLNAQGELLRQGMSFLLAEREMVETMVEPAGLPTRTEIDEVHRSVQELKRRVRQLEKTAAAAQEAGKPSTARAATTVRKLKPRAQGASA